MASLFFVSFSYLFAQEEIKKDSVKNYEFNIFDGTLDSFTMRQMNQNYLSVSRIVNRTIETIFYDTKLFGINVSEIINFLWPNLINPITHEEGHRSILTAKGIGSISQPFYRNGAAYVKGVTDKTLIDFRDTDRASFIRMYTAGIESDYMMFIREEKMAAFELDKYSVLYPDYLLRRVMVSGYLAAGIMYWDADNYGGFYEWFIEASGMNLVEEENEFMRDICGFDTFGATKALFEDDYVFKRYTQYSDFNEEEKEFIAKRIGLRAYLNFLCPWLYRESKPNFIIGDKVALSGSVGYALAPFGDFIDENGYFKYRTDSLGDLNFHFYARQAENYDTWYPAFGLSLVEFQPFDWLSLTSGVHLWWQPEDLKFFTDESFFGGAFELTAKFVLPSRLFPSKKESFIKGFGIVTSVLVKTEGFLPEIEQHGKHFRFSMGLETRF